MNRVRWAAWGVVDIEALERMQRRNYIKAVREELTEQKISLDCGGSKTAPYYRFSMPAVDEGKIITHAAGGPEAFKKACVWLLQQLGDGHVGSEDGGVRGA